MVRKLKFPTIIGALVLGLSTFIISCKSDDSQTFRAYVEGKISSNNPEIFVKAILLKSNNKIIAETLPKSSGSFVIAGPYETGDYELIFDGSIKSFETTTKGCVISKDSTKIIIPSGVTFINFENINLK